MPATVLLVLLLPVAAVVVVLLLPVAAVVIVLPTIVTAVVATGLGFRLPPTRASLGFSEEEEAVVLLVVLPVMAAVVLLEVPWVEGQLALWLAEQRGALFTVHQLVPQV